MSAIARFLVGWTAISMTVSPFIGMLLKRQQIDVAVPTPRQLDLAAVPTPVPAR